VGLSKVLPLIFVSVMAGLRPGHPRLSCLSEDKTWMPGTRPGMTSSVISAIPLAAFWNQTLWMMGMV
jgi:hypothetical protein